MPELVTILFGIAVWWLVGSLFLAVFLRGGAHFAEKRALPFGQAFGVTATTTAINVVLGTGLGWAYAAVMPRRAPEWPLWIVSALIGWTVLVLVLRKRLAIGRRRALRIAVFTLFVALGVIAFGWGVILAVVLIGTK